MARFICRLDQYDLDLDSITDEFPNSLVESEFPFQDGVGIDYLGERARRISFNAYFNRGGYRIHKNFLSHIRSGRIYELAHPIYGLIKGRIEKPKVEHDNRINFCIINFTFIEQKIGDEITPLFSVRLEVASSFVAVQLSMPNVVSAASSLGKEALQKPLVPDQSLIAQFAAFDVATRAKIAEVEKALNTVNNFFADITIPVDSVINAIEFGTALPDLICQSSIQCVGRICEALRLQTNSPSLFLNSVNNNLTQLNDLIVTAVTDANVVAMMINTIQINTSQYTAVVVSEYYAVDEDQRDAYLQELQKVIFDIEGNKIADRVPVSLYNQNELEKSLYMSREMLAMAMNLNRDNLAIHKEIGYALERHVNTIKLERDRIVEFDVGEYETPLHLVCRQQGLNPLYDAQIMAINDIPNPFFCTGKIQIYKKVVTNGQG